MVNRMKHKYTFRERFLEICRGGVLGISEVICLYLFVTSIFFTCLIWYDHEMTHYIKDFPWLIMPGLIGLVFLAYLARNPIRKFLARNRVLLFAATVVWLVIMILFIRNTNTVPVYDQALIYRGMKSFAEGNYELWKQGEYFYLYPFQSGIVLLYAPIALLFPANIFLAVQYTNVAFYLLLVIGIYKLTARYFNASAATCTYLATLYLFPLWGYVKYLYGNLPGIAISMWAFYLISEFVSTRKYRFLAGGTICLSIAAVFKTNFYIHMIAILIFLLLEALRQKRICFVFSAMILFAGVMLAVRIPPLVLHLLSGYDTSNGIPTLHWILMGLRESTIAPGWYNGESGKWFIEVNFSTEQITQESREGIAACLRYFAEDPAYALRFFSRKIASIWNDPTFEGFDVVRRGNLYGTLSYRVKDILYCGGIVNTILTLIIDLLQSIYLFGVVLYLMYCKKEFSIDKMLPLVTMIGGFIFHIFWEAKCQYTIIYFVMFLPYAMRGYQKVISMLEQFFDTRREQRALQTVQRSSFAANCKTLLRNRSAQKFGALMLLLIFITINNSYFVTWTFKITTDTADYIWLCKNEDYWRADDYTKEGMDH